MRWFIYVVCVFCGLSKFPTRVCAQLSAEEAEQRLAERREAAATQPADTASQIAMLKSIIADQRQQIADLQGEIKSLKAPQPLAKMADDVHPKHTFTSRAQNYIETEKIDAPTSKKLLADAKKIDADIDDYASSHQLNPKITEAMHEGIPVLKMPEDALSIFSRVTTQLETINGKMLTVARKDSSWWLRFNVTVSDGVVIGIEPIEAPSPAQPSGFFNSGGAFGQ
jgi:hypothetical protein